MALTSVDDTLPDEWKNLRIKRKSLCKLYYVRDGRNAWHSTWIKRWYPKSFHFNKEGARLYAEILRTNGSVFWINELPFVCYETKLGTLLISELNTRSPLDGYSQPMNAEDLLSRNKSSASYWRHNIELSPWIVRHQLSRIKADGSVKKNICLEDLFNTYLIDSLYWTTPGKERSIIKLISNHQDSKSLLALRENERLKSWKSYSVGGQYDLEWSNVETPFTSKSAARIVRFNQ